MSHAAFESRSRKVAARHHLLVVIDLVAVRIDDVEIALGDDTLTCTSPVRTRTSSRSPIAPRCPRCSGA